MRNVIIVNKKALLAVLIMFKSLLDSISGAIFPKNSSASSEPTEPRRLSAMDEEAGKWIAMAEDGQSVHLIELNEMLLEKILENLSVQDLAAFRCTCRTFRNVSPS